MATLRDHYYSHNGYNSISEPTFWVAQTFTAASSYNITSIKIAYYRLGLPRNVTVSIRATNESGAPVGNDLASFTFDGDTLTTNTNGEWTERSFDSQYPIISGTKYAIVIRKAGPVVDGQLRYRRYSPGTYANGGLYVNSDSGSDDNWGDELASDIKFAIYGDDLTPSEPTNPIPINDATGVDFSSRVLDWVDGGGTDSYDVYMGPSGNLSLISEDLVPSTLTVDLSDVPKEQVIYWRVDAKNVYGTTTGNTWNFDARPVKAITPSPTDAASDITLDESPLSWVDGGNTDTYEIYFREQGEDWDLIGAAQVGVEYVLDFGYIDYEKTYEWRVDATNEFGTTTGDTWSFDSIVFDPILPGASGGSGGGGGGGGSGEESSPTGENNMITLRRLVAAANSKIWYEDI